MRILTFLARCLLALLAALFWLAVGTLALTWALARSAIDRAWPFRRTIFCAALATFLIHACMMVHNALDIILATTACFFAVCVLPFGIMEFWPIEEERTK